MTIEKRTVIGILVICITVLAGVGYLLIFLMPKAIGIGIALVFLAFFLVVVLVSYAMPRGPQGDGSTLERPSLGDLGFDRLYCTME